MSAKLSQQMRPTPLNCAIEMPVVVSAVRQDDDFARDDANHSQRDRRFGISHGGHAELANATIVCRQRVESIPASDLSRAISIVGVRIGAVATNVQCLAVEEPHRAIDPNLRQTVMHQTQEFQEALLSDTLAELAD